MFFDKLKQKLLKKKGNSYLFMPFFVTFSITFVYMYMEMGFAYARSVQLQTLCDTSCQAGVYAGTQGENKTSSNVVHRYKDGSYHVFVSLDFTEAQGVARKIIEANLETMKFSNNYSTAHPGAFVLSMDSGVLFNSIDVFRSRASIWGVDSLPVWTDGMMETSSDGYGEFIGTANTTGNPQGARYVPVRISQFDTPYQIAETGNFSVYVEGDYKTIIPKTFTGREKTHLTAFAAATAYATIDELEPSH